MSSRLLDPYTSTNANTVPSPQQQQQQQQQTTQAQTCCPRSLIKTQPRSILKKATNHNNENLRKTPKFFTGNETNLIECIEDELDELTLSRIGMMQSDSLQSPSPSITTHANIAINEERFKKSSLGTTIAKKVVKKLRRRRPLSAVYILHSREITRGIIKLLLNETEDFLDEFRCNHAAETPELSDTELFVQRKTLLVANLRDFLKGAEESRHHCGSSMPGSNRLYGSLGLEATMSEPAFADLDKLRRENKVDRMVTASIEEVTDSFVSSSIDASGNIKDECFVGSLPTSSMLSEFSKRIKQSENNNSSFRYKCLHASDFLLHKKAFPSINEAG